jgi:hypothetical protein
MVSEYDHANFRTEEELSKTPRDPVGLPWAHVCYRSRIGNDF